MQLQERMLELLSKKVSGLKSALSGKLKLGKARSINKNLLDEVISDELISWKARVEQGIEKNKKLSMEFISWVIIEYNLKAAEKIDPESLDIINEVFKRLKERGVVLDEEDINKKILSR